MYSRQNAFKKEHIHGYDSLLSEWNSKTLEKYRFIIEIIATDYESNDLCSDREAVWKHEQILNRLVSGMTMHLVGMLFK